MRVRVLWVFDGLEIPWYEADTSPIVDGLLILPTEFDEEAAAHYPAAVLLPDEIDGVDFDLEDDLERARFVLFDLHKLVRRKGFLNVLLDGFKIALNEVQRDMLDVLVQPTDLIDELVWGGYHELLPLLTSFHGN